MAGCCGLRNYLRLRDAVGKVLGQEHHGSGKGIGFVDKIFTLRLTIEKWLSNQTPLVLSLEIKNKRLTRPIEEP